jgi:hypothetical protein
MSVLVFRRAPWQPCRAVRPLSTGDPAFRLIPLYLPAELSDRIADAVGPELVLAGACIAPAVHVSASVVLATVVLEGVAALQAEAPRARQRRAQRAIGSYLALYGGGHV